ncbi:MAG: phosphoglycerate dehydrogenase [Clostridia bacterium]|nr:phosphoglycerate dehydrogenase [Clostridia bacterium]
MYKIKTLNSIDPVWKKILSQDEFQVASDVEDMDAIIVRSADMHGMDTPDSLLCVGRAGAGVNNIPLDEMAQKGIVVMNTPGANANAVKELVLAALLLSGRDIIGGIEWARGLKGEGAGLMKVVEKGKSNFVGNEIMGKTLGVIGLGGIGGLVANSAISLGMNVLGYDPFISVDNAWRLSRKIEHATDMADLLSRCDYVTIHVPLMDKTRGSFNAESFAAMKDGSILLNFSRGEIVDTAALLDALNSGKVRKYITDFPNAEIVDHKSVIPMPHLGASTPESEENCVDMISRQISTYLKTGSIRFSVNYPECILPPVQICRLTVLHANIPNMVGQVTGTVAALGINISSMVNQSRGQYAYTVLDLDSRLDESQIEKLRTIEGIYRVRLIED